MTSGASGPEGRGRILNTMILLVAGLALIVPPALGIRHFPWTDWPLYFWFPPQGNPSAYRWQPDILAGHLAHLAGLAGFVVVLLAAGDGPLKWLGCRREEGLVSFLVRLMLGFGIVASALLGMGLAGLLHAGVIRIVFPILAAWKARSSARSAAPAVRELAGWPRPVPIILALLVLPVMLSPEVETDSVMYHLSLPALYLGNGRFYVMPYDCTNWFNQLHELACIPALAWKLDSFGRCMNALWILCAGLAMAAVMRRLSPGRLSFLAVPLLLSTTGIPVLLASSKNDPAYLAVLAVLFAAIPAAPRAGAFFLAGILGGIAFGVKSISLLYFACMLAVAVVRAGSLRRCAGSLAVAMAGFSLTGGPWIARHLLGVGIPVFPFPGMSRMTPFFPPEGLRMAMRNGGMDVPSLDGIIATAKALPGTVVRMCPFVTAFLLAGIPAVAGLRTARRNLLLLAAFFAVPWWLVLWGRERYGLPLALPLGIFTMLAMERVLDAAKPARYMLALLAAVSLAIGFFRVAVESYHESPVPHFLGMENSSTYLARVTAPWDDAMKEVARARDGRTLLVGEIRTFPYTSGAIFDARDFMGTPVLWKAAHDSTGPAGMLKKLRQCGIRRILYNYAWLPFHMDLCGLYPWTGRQLAVYKALFTNRGRLRWMSRGFDPTYGAFTPQYGAYALYEISDRPYAAPETPYFLPGIDGAFLGFMRLAERFTFSPELDREIGQLDASIGHLGVLENRKAAIYYIRSRSPGESRHWSDLAAGIWWKTSRDWKAETRVFAATNPSRFLPGIDRERFASAVYAERLELPKPMFSALFMVGIPAFTTVER